MERLDSRGEGRLVGVDRKHYHGWHGTLHSPWLATLAIVRVALMQVFRRKLYWVVLGLGLLNFLLVFAVIYVVTQVQLPPRAKEAFFDRLGFTAVNQEGRENGYIAFMDSQSQIVALLLAFSGSLVVGSDFRLKSLPFFLSRRIDRRHYIVGKLLAVSSIVSLLTVVPALILFLEYGLFEANLNYYFDNWRIVPSVLGYGLVLCTVLSILLVTVSAHLQRTAPIAIAWVGAFLLLGVLSELLRNVFDDRYWRLLNLWRDMRMVGRLCFDRIDDPTDLRMAWYALAILSTLCVVSLIALVHRVRAVDVVE
jgi:ABC-2 type transport system permease protein